jgi:transcriptional regulator of acetoin/glycerol metabolism
MENQIGYADLIQFFRTKPPALPGDLAFSWAFCVLLLEAGLLAAFTICEVDQIQPSDFPAWLLSAIKAEVDHAGFSLTANGAHRPELTHISKPETYPDRDRQRYLKALESTKYSGTGRWNLSAAARQLGVPRKTLIYRLQKMQLIK